MSGLPSIPRGRIRREKKGSPVPGLRMFPEGITKKGDPSGPKNKNLYCSEVRKSLKER